jgi:serine/threonine-protein kinase
MAPARAVKILLPILDGLAAAHAKGIVHRDVKPANVFLATDAEGRMQPKLLDFGVARFVNTRLRITSPGMVCGTAFYMSPEQARGSAEVDPRSDIYSFCASLYELVSGAPPFDGENYNAVLAAVLASKPRKLVDLAAADSALSAIVMRGLSRAPDKRFATAQELGGELAQRLLDQGEEFDICGHSLRERLVAQHPASRPYRARQSTPRALSATVAAQRSPAPLAHRALRAAVATLAVGTLLGSGAYAFRPAAEPAAVEPEVAAGLAPQRARPSAPLVSLAAQSALEVTLPDRVPEAQVAVTRPPAKPPARALAKPSGAEREAAPAAAASRPAAPVAPARPRKTNALGYDFGF